MTSTLVERYHQTLPNVIRRYLTEQRGLSEGVIKKFRLGWNGQRITIPIFDKEGKFAFFKLAKAPWDQSETPKMLVWPPGVQVELYGWERVLAKPVSLVICEGEYDRLLLESLEIPAITSTGGAGVFKAEWAKAFQEIPEIYVCFDNDQAGRDGTERVGRLLPQARIVTWPEEVGPGGDVTDFFVKLGKCKEDFFKLLEGAQPLPKEVPERPKIEGRAPRMTGDGEIDQLKARVSIEEVIHQYIPLRPSGRTYVGRCCFHDDRLPSLVVYPDTQSFYCFGCQKGGDVLRFLMEREHLSFPEALEVLARFTGASWKRTSNNRQKR